jgi:hypothetical protein
MSAAEETRIFGAVLLEQRRVMRELAGEEVYAAAMAELPEDVRREYERLSMLSWCRHSTATEVTQRIGHALGRRPEAWQAEVVRTGIERTLSGVWKVLLRFSSDDALIKRTALLYSKACDRGRLTAEQLAPGHVKLTLSEWPDIPELDLIALATGIETVLRVVGRKTVIVTWAREPPVVTFTVKATADSKPPLNRSERAPSSDAPKSKGMLRVGLLSSFILFGCGSNTRTVAEPSPSPTAVPVVLAPHISETPTAAPEQAPPDPCHIGEELTLAHEAIARSAEPLEWLRQARARLFSSDEAERALGGISQEIVSLLWRRRYEGLVHFTSPKGLCLRAAKGASCETLTLEELAACGHSPKRRPWAVATGQDASPEYTCGEAFRKIFYARDFLRAPEVHFNCFPEPGRGNNRAPIVLSGPARGYVEFHDPGGSDGIGRSLWLVFDGEPDNPVLVEMISD